MTDPARFAARYPFTLDGFQTRANDALAAGESVLVAAPTGSGKTVVAALAISGFEEETFTFLGFPPTRSKDRAVWISRLASNTGTVVFFEAPHRLRETLGQISRLIGDRHVSVGRELTKAHEEFV